MFFQAKPIAPIGINQEKNYLICYKITVRDLNNATLHLACADVYQIYVDGELIAAGPARTVKGCAREDVIRLNRFTNSKSEIIINVIHYGCHSLSTTPQPHFLLAEVQSDGKSVLYTGKHFTAYPHPFWIKETERYSYQRHFSEVWDFRKTQPPVQVPTEEVTYPEILCRRAPYPRYRDVLLYACSVYGTLSYDASLPVRTDPYSVLPSKTWGRFDGEEIEYRPYTWIQSQRQNALKTDVLFPLTLSESEYTIVDLTKIYVGFLQFDVQCLAEAEVVVAFSEYCPNENYFQFTDLDVYNAAEYLFQKGDARRVFSFEPYTGRYFIIAAKKGSIVLNAFGVKTYEREEPPFPAPDFSDETLNRIYRAGVRSFTHNSVDVPSDCPSRERAGWLCDSFFNARTEYALYGKTQVEDAHLENYLKYRNEGGLPLGMVPPCLPSSVREYNTFIPQWSLWLVLQIDEYVYKRGHETQKEAFRPLIQGILSFFENYKNEDGLLERLPSWNFVEWSKANDWTQDVNYPTNFLYAKALDCAARLLDNESLLSQSDAIRTRCVEQSFRDGLFYDHAVRKNGKLTLLSDCSEVAQYYAIIFGNVDLEEERYRTLSQLVYGGFSPLNRTAPSFIEEVNAFMGMFLRLELLISNGRQKLATEEIKFFFGKMEEKTGTVWENRTPNGSLDHGFSSYVTVLLQKLLL